MNIDVVTLFPDFFDHPLSLGLVGKSIAAGRATVRTVDPRAYTHDRHRTVDDTPYGGGGGMVMKPEPVVAAIRTARGRGGGPVVLMSPQGRPLRQEDFERWAGHDHLVLVAGRYEGYDERIRRHVDDEVSLGDFVLTGGEYAALTIIDGVIRLLPGTLGNKDCPEEDSFADGLLEYPHYTRPADFEGAGVPDILQSGHHQRVLEWRRAQALVRTRERRPDLLRRYGLSPDDAAALRSVPGRPAVVAMSATEMTGPVLAVARAFAAQVYVIASDPAERSAAEAKLAALEPVAYPVREGPRPKKRRSDPPSTTTVDLGADVQVVDGWDAVPQRLHDRPVVCLAAERMPPLDAVFEDPIRYRRATDAPIPCVAFGAPSTRIDRHLPVIRGHEPNNRLTTAATLAIYLDRLIGEA